MQWFTIHEVGWREKTILTFYIYIYICLGIELRKTFFSVRLTDEAQCSFNIMGELWPAHLLISAKHFVVWLSWYTWDALWHIKLINLLSNWFVCITIVNSVLGFIYNGFRSNSKLDTQVYVASCYSCQKANKATGKRFDLPQRLEEVHLVGPLCKCPIVSDSFSWSCRKPFPHYPFCPL